MIGVGKGSATGWGGVDGGVEGGVGPVTQPLVDQSANV